MCGIFALFLRRPLSEADFALGRAGRDALTHRGPDGSGEWIDQAAGVYLGHRRLAIIDLSPSSDQPLLREGTALVYNGELYNFRDVRWQLRQHGVKFSTSGDVEVVLEAWRQWGVEAVHRFDGMFASVVWTGECAYLAVDHFGEKPLYYAETEDGVYVSSELPPLVRLLGLTPSLSPEALAAYLSLGYVPPPETAFLSVHRMPAATIAEIRGGTVAKTCTYWTPPLGTPGRGRPRPLGEDDLTRLQEALSESLQGRLIADVPLCIFLSAGIDSALVAAMAQRDFDSELECVSVSFPDDGGDDDGSESEGRGPKTGGERKMA